MPQYQGVWTLEQQAQAQSNQQWVTDPNFKNTTLLLQADGTGSGSQNNTFLDGSTNNFFITRNGNTTQGSFSPFSQAPGYWGNYFDGSSYLSIANNANLNLGSSNFTIEFWVYAPSSTNPYAIISKGNTTSVGSEAWSVEWTNTTGTLGYGCGAFNGWASPIVTGTVTLNAWNHVAVVRNGTTHTLYINGTSASTATASYTVTSAGSLYIGTGWYAPSSRYMVGYVSNARVVIGTAVYTSNFTPSTTPLTAITNTQLLTCQSNRFVDNSTNAFAITTSGTPSVQAFGPFAPALQWTPDVVGGSGYFDGSGDYLSLTPTTAFQLGSGDFTIEFWINFNAISSGQALVNYGYENTTNRSFIVYLNSDNTLHFAYSTTGSNNTDASLGALTPSIGAWAHIAVVRSGTTVTGYKNGVALSSPLNISTNTIYYPSTSGAFRVGTDSTNYFNGYMSSNRILKGTALYTTTFTPPTAPLTAITNTQLLLNYTNAGIYDGTMNTSWETVNSAQVSTSTVKNGSGSIYFNGTASQRLLPSQLYPQLTFGTGDFTLECWLYIIGKNASTIAGIIDYRPGVNGTYINWVVDFGGYGGSATAPTLVLYADSSTFIRSNVITMGVWNHVALCRANSVTRMFINGILASTPTADTKNYGSGGSAGNYRPTIGCTDGGDSLFGYIDDFRASRFARYIANFTPPQQALPRQ